MLSSSADEMTVEITPQGTRGPEWSPRAARIFNAFGVRINKLGANKDQVLLITKGARSGEERTVSVRRFDEEDGKLLVVGSKGGSATHPAWFINLAKNPDSVWIQVKGKKVKVTPRSLHGDERASAWKRIVAEASNFGAYETKTDREIPVVRLTPAA
jgi:deazaflavin-dependent oxidoreductase (nitroreductase family)